MAPIHAVANDPELKGKVKDVKPNLYNYEEQLIIDGLILVLEPFKEASEKLSAVKFPTLSLVLPSLATLKNAIEPTPLHQEEDSDEEDSEYRKAHKVVENVRKQMRDIIDTKLATSQIHEVATMLDPAAKPWIIKTKGLEYVSKSLLELLCQQQVVQPGVQIKQEPGLPPAEAEAEGVPALPNFLSQPDDSDEDTEEAGNPAKKIKKEKEEDCVYDRLSDELTIIKVAKPEQNVT